VRYVKSRKKSIKTVAFNGIYTVYYRSGFLGFDFRRGLGNFLFTTASRTALGLTQPPFQWVLGVLSLRVKRPGREADHSPPSSAEVKECVELYLYSPNAPSWCGAQLKKHKEKFIFIFTWYIIGLWAYNVSYY
jgi:hypothetical protein